MDRRGFLKLAGLASAATVLAKHAILPARAQPHPDWRDAADRMGMVEERRIEAGLILNGTNEASGVGYCRVTPEVKVEDGKAKVRVTFPIAGENWGTIQRFGLFDRKTRELLFWQDFDAAVTINAGNALQVGTTIVFDGQGMTASAMKRLLGVA